MEKFFWVYLFGTGGNALVARKIGEGKHQEARKDFSLLMAAAFIFGVVLTIISFIFLDPLCRFLGSDDGKTSAVLSFCRTVIFMVIPVLVLPNLFGMNGVWISITVGEVLSLAMSIFYFIKYRNMWKASGQNIPEIK